MKLFQSIPLTIAAGVVLSILIVLVMGPTGYNGLEMVVWAHVIVGITWIGLLYYFNLVQVPAVNQAVADGDPGPAAINKYVAPRALFLFRWSAALTWLTGAAALETLHANPGSGIIAAFTFADERWALIGVGAWLGTIMLFNVWVLIWPNQKKLLGIVPATDEEKAAAKKTALIASRANTLLSIPMLMSMTMFSHGGLPF
jgi:uncharacterized membrane protein